MQIKFDILFMESAREFLANLDERTRTKVLYNMDRSRVLNDPRLFKKLTSDIWEFRTHYNGIQYRLLAFWDTSTQVDTLVIATHGIVKKSDVVPPKEISRSEKLRKLYFDQMKLK